MKTILFFIFYLITISSFSQKINVRDSITISNANLIDKFDKKDIESMVTYYFASRIRNDNKWREVLQDSSEWSSRMKYSLKKHNSWTFIKFKNLGLYTSERGSTYVKVYFLIKVDGKEDGGKDDVELTKQGETWIISEVPI